MVLKTARYVDPEEVIALGDIMLFVGGDFIVSVRHGEASGLRERPQACGVRREAAQVRHGRGAPRDRRPRGRRLLPGARGRGERHRRDRGRGVLALARQPRGAHLQAQARGARVLPRDSAAGRSARPPGERQVSADSRAHQLVLPRRLRPPAARRSETWRGSANCSPAFSRPTSRRSACARTRTCGRSRPGSRSPRCRR